MEYGHITWYNPSDPCSAIRICKCRYDVIKRKHFPRYWLFVRGIHRSPVYSPLQAQWRGALKFSLNCAWINGWVNNRAAGNSKRHRAHYDVIAMVPWASVLRHLKHDRWIKNLHGETKRYAPAYSQIWYANTVCRYFVSLEIPRC